MQQEEMSFWDHLEELRWTLFRSVLALFVFAIAGFSVMPWLFDNVVMAPCSSDFIVYREMCKISSHFSFLPDFPCEHCQYQAGFPVLHAYDKFFLVGVIIDFPLFDVGDLEVRKSGSLRE